MSKEAKKKLAGDAFSLSMSRIVTTASRVIYLLLAARLLGPELYGLFVYSQSWYLIFLPLAMLGLRTIALRDMGRERKNSDDILQQALFLMICSSIFVSLLSAFFGYVSEDNPLVRNTILIFSLALLIRSLNVHAETIFMAYERPRILLPISLILRPLETLTGIAALLLGGGLIALASIHTAVWAAQAGILYFLAFKQKLQPPPALINRTGKRMILQGLPMLMSGILIGQIQRGPVLYFRWIGGVNLGQLSILIQFISAFSVVPTAIHQSLLPAMSRKAAYQEADAHFFTERISSFFFSIAAFAGLAAMVLADPVLLPLLGSRYELAVRHMGLAVFILGLYGAGLSIIQLLTAKGKYITSFMCIAFGAFLMIAVFLVFKPKMFLWALVFEGLGFAGCLLFGSVRLGMLRYICPRLFMSVFIIVFPYIFNQSLWSIGAGIFLWCAVTVFFYGKERRLFLETISQIIRR